jgi:hypothetical protein
MSTVRVRKNKSLQRKRKKPREPYDVVLIVCEGAKTEPEYFKALKNELRLSSTNIRICGKECGSAPVSVVDYAIEESKKFGDYNRVYCVFDRDRHETYETALNKVNQTKLRNGAKISAITSVPCFEYWLLLHFADTARPYGALASVSPCEELLRDLKTHISGYEKGSDVFSITYPLVDEALRRAKIRERNCVVDGTDNPSTKVHELVVYLRELKKEPEETTTIPL